MEYNKQLVEDTVGANAPNIATTDENISPNKMFHEATSPSLGRQIFAVAGINGPTAALFNIRRKDVGDDAEIVRSEVEVYPSSALKTGLTKEAIQDIVSQYGAVAYGIIGKMLRALANEQENTRTLAFLDAESAAETALALTDPKNSESILFEITKYASELVMKANTPRFRTYESYCVLPYQYAGAVSAMTSLVANDEEGNDLHIGSNGKMRFYLNPDPTSTTVYVGLCKKSDPSLSAATFSPYVSTVVDAEDFSTGESTYHIYNRFAITKSPLSVASNEMMFKFAIS